MTALYLYSTQEKLANDLWEAVQGNNVSEVRSLLEQGADPNHQLYWKKDWKYPLIHWACLLGCLKIVKMLVVHGARTDQGDRLSNRVPLHFACKGGHKEVVQYLIKEVRCKTSK